MPEVPPFAVLILGRTPRPDIERAALAAGAALCLHPDDRLPAAGPALGVLIDPGDGPDAAALARAVHLVLAALAGDEWVVLGRPVTDTLKLVDGAGVLRGTADREAYRWLSTPLAGPLPLLRAAIGATPDGGASGPAGGVAAVSALLDRLVAQGARIRVVQA
jgi:2-C-methyl-D-erythritol 4-phosphate cytidylyltransferase